MSKIKVNWSIRIFTFLFLVLVYSSFSYSQTYKNSDQFLTKKWNVGDTWITKSINLNHFNTKINGWSLPVLNEYTVVGKNTINNTECFLVEKRPYPPTGEERQLLYFRSADKKLVRQTDYRYLQGRLHSSTVDFPIINSTPILKTEWLPDRLELIKNGELIAPWDDPGRSSPDQGVFDQRGRYLSQTFRRLPVQDWALTFGQDALGPREFLSPQQDLILEARLISGTPEQRVQNTVRASKQYWSSEFPWFFYEEMSIENIVVKKTWLIRSELSSTARERFHPEFPVDLLPSWEQINPMQFPLALNTITETKTASEPWAGWWWPLWDGNNPNLYDITGNWQPLKRYDDRVKPSSSARDWEYMNDNAIWNDDWSGHCHAWASASIKESKPSVDNGALTKGDLEGLLVECYDFVDDEFSGKYMTSNEDNIPMKPGDFLLALKETIGAASPRPIIMDLHTGDAYTGYKDKIQNFPIYHYDLNCSLINGRLYNCTTEIWFKIDTPMPGENGYLTRDIGRNNYSFTVEIQDGIPVSGTGAWTSYQISPIGAGNRYPDWAWYPGSPQAYNPNVNCNTVKALIENKADFVITGITLSPGSPTAGGTFSAQVTVKNQGMALGNGGRLDIWTDQASAPACGATGDQQVSVGTLGAEESRTFTFNSLGAGTAGTKTFRAFVDSSCQTLESVEGNNQNSQSYTVSPVDQPDLVVTGITLNPTSPTANETFSAQVTVKNQGTVTGNGGRLDIWSDQASAQTCGATGNQNRIVGTLGAGESRIFTFSNLGTGAAGTKTFRAFVDSLCQTTESSEGNNQTSLSYTRIENQQYIHIYLPLIIN